MDYSSEQGGGWAPATLGIHAGGPEQVPGGPVVLPIIQSSTFFWRGPESGELRYTRYGNNPNQIAVAEKVSALEGMEASLAVGSGMAATALTMLALTKKGDHIVASKHLYGTTQKFLESELPNRGVQTTFVQPENPRLWRGAIQSNTRLIFLEIPTNPTMRVFDPKTPARLARQEGLAMVVDSTFASPINLRMAEHGADVVIHSATKYLGGHSDLIAGVVSGSQGLIDEVRRMLALYGAALDPHAAWLLDRGLKTLSVRMARHNESGLAIATWLEGHPEVKRVFYPGLDSHPDKAIAAELLNGFGGMIGVVLDGGGPKADSFCRALELAKVAPSLGGVETLVSQPRFTSHAGMSPAERAELEIPDSFVRISVGLEDVDDLTRDLAQALRSAG